MGVGVFGCFCFIYYNKTRHRKGNGSGRVIFKVYEMRNQNRFCDVIFSKRGLTEVVERVKTAKRKGVT